MSIEKKTFSEEQILFCPFTYSCILPQTNVICDFPCYKVCPEYRLKERQLKQESKTLY